MHNSQCIIHNLENLDYLELLELLEKIKEPLTLNS